MTPNPKMPRRALLCLLANSGGGSGLTAGQ